MFFTNAFNWDQSRNVVGQYRIDVIRSIEKQSEDSCLNTKIISYNCFFDMVSSNDHKTDRAVKSTH